MSSTETMLELASVQKLYAPQANGGPVGGVHASSFTLDKGTFFSLLGPSGCGKTTTLRCIAGLEEPDSGIIRIGGNLVFDEKSNVSVPLNRRNIGMVFQSYAIWPHMDVFENVAFPLRVAKDKRRGKDEIGRMVNEALETVGLGGYADRPATRLSGGQQQRVALARAIVRKPSLLLLDEPLSNLDASLREEMRDELRRLQQNIGVTTVYVTHDQSEALEMSDQIAVMEHGRVVQLDTPRKIYRQPSSRFVAEFVGTSNWIDGILAGRESDLIALRLVDGRVVYCKDLAVAAQGKALRVALRPEAIAISAADSSKDALPPGTNRLEGVVTFAGFVGNMMRYRIDLNGFQIQAYAPPQSPFDLGQKVTLTFAAGDAIPFTATA